jgi:hypothetical protein
MQQNDRDTDLLEEVRKRMRQILDNPGIGENESQTAERLNRLREAALQAHKLSRRVGSLPPQPDTPRARLSMWLVRLVRQALFWYTPQIVDYQSTVSEALEMQVAVFEAMGRRLERAEARAAAFQLEMDRLSAGQ